MPRDSVTTGVAVLIVVVGLLALLFGEATPNDEFVMIGGIVALVGMGVLTMFVAGLE